MRILIYIAAVVLSACGQAENTSDNSANTIHTNAESNISTSSIGLYAGCYQMTKGRDSGWMQIEIKDSIVTGKLVYDWWEKDRNEGTISGVLRDSLLFLDYSFQSEGMKSVREEIFRVADKELIPAYGSVQEKEGKMVFTDVKVLSFHQDLSFQKTDCRN